MFSKINTVLDQHHPGYELNAAKGFTQMEVLATVDPLHFTAALPVITVQLQNDTDLFTCYLQPINGTAAYAAMDVLAAVRQLPALKEAVFTKLYISCAAPLLLQEGRALQLVCNLAE